MKKTLLLSSMFVSSISFAQFKTGDKLVSGNIGLNLSSAKPTNGAPYYHYKNTGFNFGVSSSTFKSSLVFNTFGFYVSHSVNKTITPLPINQVINSNLGYGVSFSHTRLLPLTKNLYLNFPLNVRAGFNGSVNENGAGASERRNKGLNLSAGINAGLLYQLNKRWLLSLSLPDIASVGFSRGTEENYVNGVLQANKYRSNSFGFSSGLSSRALGDLSVGFSYLIPSRKK